MPYSTLVAGTTITASWANANVRDQTVAPFANASARASAITSPVEGMLSYRTDDKVYESYDGLQWVPLPGTVIARGRRTTSSTGTTSEVGVLRLDGVSLISGRLYAVRTGLLALNGTVATDTFFARIRYDTTGANATTSSTILPGADAQDEENDASWHSTKSISALYVPGANQTVSFLLTAGRLIGSGTVTLQATATDRLIEMLVTDLGVDVGDTGVDI